MLQPWSQNFFKGGPREHFLTKTEWDLRYRMVYFFAEKAISYPGAKRIDKGWVGWLIALGEGLRIFYWIFFKAGNGTVFHVHRDVYITLGG